MAASSNRDSGAPPQATAAARLFLALLPDPAARAGLAAHVDRWQWDSAAQRYAPADWHVTLHFIGPVLRPLIGTLKAALAVRLTPFALQFGIAELWPHGIAVLRPIAVPQALQQLHGQLGNALQGFGLRLDDRPFRPHITLARHASQARPPQSATEFGWQVQGYALMESTGQAPQRYRVLQAYGAAP